MLLLNRNYCYIVLISLRLVVVVMGKNDTNVSGKAEVISSYDEANPEPAGMLFLPPVIQIPYGRMCEKSSAEECMGYPNVDCTTDSLRISTCRCNYLSTRTRTADNKDLCVLNVFSPCSSKV